MTMAFQDIEDQLSTATPAQAQVLIVAKDAYFGEALKSMMAEDDAVSGEVHIGELSGLAQDARQNWSCVDFVVFQATPGDQAELAAVRSLLGKPGAYMQCLAMHIGDIAPEHAQAYLAAGVREVMRANIPAQVDAGLSVPAPVVAAPQPAANTTPTGGRLHLSEPQVKAPAAPAVDAGAGLGEVTVVLRARGGAGASTVATNLAVSIAQTSSTVLVDMDIQNGNVAMLLDMQDSAEFCQLIRSGSSVDATFLDRALVQHGSGLWILPAPDIFLPMTAVSLSMVTALVAGLRQRFENVIIDMPQAVFDWYEPILGNSARALLVTDTTVPSIKRAKRLIDLIAEDHMTLPVTIVVNGEARPMFPSATHKEAARLLERPLAHWIPQDAKALRNARDIGVPVAIGAKHSATSKAISALCGALFKSKSGGQA